MRDAHLCQHQDRCWAFRGSVGSCLVAAHREDEGGGVRCRWQVIIQPAATPWGRAAHPTLQAAASGVDTLLRAPCSPFCGNSRHCGTSLTSCEAVIMIQHLRQHHLDPAHNNRQKITSSAPLIHRT